MSTEPKAIAFNRAGQIQSLGTRSVYQENTRFVKTKFGQNSDLMEIQADGASAPSACYLCGIPVLHVLNLIVGCHVQIKRTQRDVSLLQQWAIRLVNILKASMLGPNPVVTLLAQVHTAFHLR